MAVVNYSGETDKDIAFFESPARLEILEGIAQGIRNNAGLIALSGESGTGKTVFIAKMLSDFPDDISTLFLRRPTLSFEELLSAICAQIHLSDSAPVPADEQTDLVARQQRFIDFITQQTAQDRRVAVLIDDAQAITVESLSRLLQLAKSLDNTPCLFSLVLVGSLELNALVSSPEIVKLTAKPPVFFRLSLLGQEDIKAFMRLRLARYKFNEKELFAPQALAKILAHTQGALRLIDSLFDSLILFSDSNNRITLAGFDEAIDFFPLLALPAGNTDQPAAKNSPLDANKQPGKGLVFSLKEKVTHLFSSTRQDKEESAAHAVTEQSEQANELTEGRAVSDTSPGNELIQSSEEQDLLKDVAINGTIAVDVEVVAAAIPEYPVEQPVTAEPQSAGSQSIGAFVISDAQIDMVTMTDANSHQADERDAEAKVDESEKPLLYLVKNAPNQEKVMNRSESLSKVLKAFKDESPDIEAAALISEDGLMIASVLPQDLDETRVGGMSATLLSLGTRSSAVLKRGELKEVIIRGGQGYAVLINAGRGTLLVAVTNEHAKLGLVFFDMRDTIEKIAGIL
jgi:predicted regulator of Ras-like GTPase activity (Roadblock/LC7/MglB family)/type II secretory pathway predicted ATPase ExeA